MIRVESIEIKEFRGIRDLKLVCNGKTFAVCGPNGTGKSGVVDALEFALTGNVSRLSGEGRGDVSLAKHGPHVDVRKDPAKAQVKLVLTIPSLNKSVTLERSVKTAAVAKITPDEPDIRSVLEQVQAHPEFVLSRRELIRYVLATPGKRAEEVGALLHLGKIERVRLALQALANSCEKLLVPLASAVKIAAGNLNSALEIPALTKENVLTAANSRRSVLGLPTLTELTASTSLKDGLVPPTAAATPKLPKVQAQADLRALRETIAEFSDPTVIEQVANVSSSLAALAADPAAADAMKREVFYSTGLSLVSSASCPLCDISWDLAELKEHLQSKLTYLQGIARKRKEIEGKIAPLNERLGKLSAALDTIVGYAKLTAPPVPSAASAEFSKSTTKSILQLTALTPFTTTLETLSAIVKPLPPEVLSEIAALDRAVGAIPEPTVIDAARDWLTVGQVRLEVWRTAMRGEKEGKERAERARRISNTYVRTSDSVLTGLYAAVQDQFAALYAFMNQSDESQFTASLIPSTGKLGFDVDFYGRGKFPPGAYHSEGHQDSMGLCLYLALMRHLQGPTFTFAVLDDVLMSVDSDHRRDVCALLKKYFPDTQFILTTHDPVWFRHMRTERIIGSRGGIQFREWSVDDGPTEWDDREVWTEIEDYLKSNDVRGAAALLRHYLEYMSKELCHRLRAPVEFRGDGQYQLGELLPSAAGRLKRLYGKGKDAANSWNQQGQVKELQDRESKLDAAWLASNAEQWQVNTAVHYNAWENLGRKDFEPVLRAFQKLLTHFACEDCGEFLRVSPDRETAEVLRCECGKTNVNFKKKRSVA